MDAIRHWSINDSWADRIDLDIGSSETGGCGANQTDEASFTRRVVTTIGTRTAPGNRGNHHHPAGLIVLDQVTSSSLDTAKCAGQIHFERSAPLTGGQLQKVAGIDNAGRIHEPS